jgi:chemotaxis protein MotB
VSDFVDEEEGQGEEESKGGGWLTTWADMMSVLLTFFIVLQAFSTLSERKFNLAVESIRQAFSVPLPMTSPGVPAFRPQDTAAEQLERSIADEDIQGVSVEDFGDRLVLTVDSELLFDVGEAELTAAGRGMIERVAGTLKSSEGRIRIEGHTCNLQPQAGGEFENNWWLSSARALTVLETLEAGGVAPERLTAAGRGEYDPVAPNDGEDNRRRNRRVEFIIEKGRLRADEP